MYLLGISRSAKAVAASICGGADWICCRRGQALSLANQLSQSGVRPVSIGQPVLDSLPNVTYLGVDFFDALACGGIVSIGLFPDAACSSALTSRTKPLVSTQTPMSPASPAKTSRLDVLLRHVHTRAASKTSSIRHAVAHIILLIFCALKADQVGPAPART